MTGEVESTSSAKPVAVKEVKPMAASFIYGSPTPASKGRPASHGPPILRRRRPRELKEVS
jgi:hypothetical protein